MNKTVEDSISFEALYDSMYKCKKNVGWKESVASYYLNGFERTVKLEKALKDGTYKPRQPQVIEITYPKKRTAVCIPFTDRVYQRSLNDNIIYPIMTKSFIYPNLACQKGKGTDKFRDILDKYLHQFYRKHGVNGYVLQCDIKEYYGRMNHKFTENMFKSKLDFEAYKRVYNILRFQYDTDTGYNPGSQLIQIAGISSLDYIDHYIKEQLHIRYYLRYQDDLILIHQDKQYLEECRQKIEDKMKIGHFMLHPTKTKIYSLSDGIFTLGFRHKLTESGKVIRLISPQNVKHEKLKLKRLVNKCKRGEISREDIDSGFDGWLAHASKGNTFKVRERMIKYYKSLWS